MADLQSSAPPEVQARAKEMGWIPPEEFKGDPERFTDADAFIERGETVLPIVKKQLATTRAELEAQRKQFNLTEQALRQLQEKQQEADVRHAAETARAVDEAIKATKAALAKASEAGDHEAVAELTGDLVDLDADKKAAAAAKKAIEDAGGKPEPKGNGADFKAEIDLTEVRSWIADGNEWYGTDRRRTSLMQGIAMELREKGNVQTGKAFMNTCKAEMLKTLGEGEQTIDKVEGGRNGDGTEVQVTRGGGKKNYASLPADAKAQCDKEAKQFVGPDKRYKDITAWRSKFAEIYFERD